MLSAFKAELDPGSHCSPRASDARGLDPVCMSAGSSPLEFGLVTFFSRTSVSSPGSCGH